MTVLGPPPATMTYDPCLLYISETSTSAVATGSAPPGPALAPHASMNSSTRTNTSTTTDTSTSVVMYTRHTASSSDYTTTASSYNSYTTRHVASNSDYTLASSSYASHTTPVSSVTFSSMLSSSIVDLMPSSVPVKDGVSSSLSGHSTLTSMFIPSGKISTLCMHVAL